MARFMTLTFLLLGWAFYEMSGGAGFQPPEAVPAPRIAFAAPEPAVDPAPPWMGATAAPAAPPEAAVVPFVLEAAQDTAALPAPVAAEPEVAPDLRVVAGGRVNLRSGPGTDHGVRAVLTRGDVVEALATEGRWARVRAGDLEGWMALGLLAEAG